MREIEVAGNHKVGIECKVKVNAYVVGKNLAVHRPISEQSRKTPRKRDGWEYFVTHLASGCRVTQFPYLKEARKFVKKADEWKEWGEIKEFGKCKCGCGKVKHGTDKFMRELGSKVHRLHDELVEY
jgi:hypothetical protein